MRAVFLMMLLTKGLELLLRGDFLRLPPTSYVWFWLSRASSRMRKVLIRFETALGLCMSVALQAPEAWAVFFEACMSTMMGRSSKFLSCMFTDMRLTRPFVIDTVGLCDLLCCCVSLLALIEAANWSRALR